LQAERDGWRATPLDDTEFAGPPDSLLAGPPVYEPVPLAASQRDSACYLGIILIGGLILGIKTGI
jgi:hypothetical protein